jgi:hypothetical protein
MSVQYYREESSDGEKYTGGRVGEEAGLVLDLFEIEGGRGTSYRVLERCADPYYPPAADFDYAIRLEELNLLRRIALALENLTRPA